jgi:predicted transcriptional regulator of viral defense system
VDILAQYSGLPVDELCQIRLKIEQDVFDYRALMEALSQYQKPRDKITKLLASGVILRIKKGLYCFGEVLSKEPIPRESVANLIYGPSYVSLDYALSYHGLVPERVETVTSVTTGRSRNFDTPLGHFSYRMLQESRYAIGVLLEQSSKTNYLIATAEKALIDKVWADKRLSGQVLSDFDTYLNEDLRIDQDALNELDLYLLRRIAATFGSSKIRNLVQFLDRAKRINDA